MQSEYKGYFMEEGEEGVVYVYDSVEAWRERRWVYIGDNEYLAKMWVDLLVGDARVGIAESLSGGSTNWSPSQSYWHGTDRSGTISSLITEGLRAGSSVSSVHGQATAYPILLEYVDLQVDPVSYRPGDFRTLGKSGKPASVLVVPEDFGKGVRTIDEINTELAEKLGSLEAQGVSPEEVGAMSRAEQYRIDKRLGELMSELDKSITLESRGLRGEMGGEDILRQVAEQACGTGVPVYRVERDEEGEISWGSRRLVQ